MKNTFYESVKYNSNVKTITLGTQIGTCLTNEDYVDANTYSALIMDGETGIDGISCHTTTELTDVKWFVNNFGREFMKSGTFYEKFSRAQEYTAERYGKVDKMSSPSASLGYVKWNEKECKQHVLGTCYIITLLKSGSISTLVNTNKRKVDAENRALEANHLSFGVSPEIVENEMRSKRIEDKKKTQQDDTYYLVDLCTPDIANHAVAAKFDMSAVDCVLMCTDGFYSILDTPLCSNEKDLVETTRLHGGDFVIEQLRRAEYDITDSIERPRLKKSDDASFALLEFT